jgi:hypothetical protein
MLFGEVFGRTNNVTNINQKSNTVVNKQTSSIHIFDLDGAKPQFYSPTGSRTIMNADNKGSITSTTNLSTPDIFLLGTLYQTDPNTHAHPVCVL